MLNNQLSIPLKTNINLENQNLYSISSSVPSGQWEFMFFAQESAYSSSTHVDNSYFTLDDNTFYAKKAGVYSLEALLYVGWNTAEQFSVHIYAGVSDADISLTISPSSSVMSASRSMKINSQIKVPYGQSKSLKWSVSGSNYASISSSGTLSVSSKLTTPTQLYIKAYLKSYPAISDDCYVTVYPKPIKINISTKSISLVYDVTKPAPTQQIVTSFLPSNARQDFICKTSNSKVATVDSSGNITAVGKGKATITFTHRDITGLKATCIVNVYVPVSSYYIYPYQNKTDYIPGQKVQFYASFTPQYPSDKTINWSVSVNGLPDWLSNKYASISSSGKLQISKYCITPSSIVVSARAKGAASEEVAVQTYEVTVYPRTKKLTLNQSSASLFVGQTFQATVSIDPTQTQGKIKWTTSSSKTATVSENGLVTAISKGTATITAQALDGSGVKATCKVKVSIPVTSITLDDGYAAIGGTSLILKPKILPTNATDKTIIWSVDKPEYATISNTGVLSVNVKCPVGTTIRVSVTASGAAVPVVGSCKVIACPYATSINTTSELIQNLDELETLKLSVCLTPISAMPVLWSSSNVSIATVDQQGLVTAVKHSSQPVMITAKTQDGSKLGIPFIIHVTKHIYDPISSFSLGQQEVYLQKGKTRLLSASVLPAGANQKVSWESNKTTCVTVDSAGLITGKSEGTAIITGTAANGKKLSCTVKVSTYEYATFPLKYANISQGPNGSDSHVGYHAIDIFDADGRVKAPFTCVIKKIIPEWGNAVIIESTYPVNFANGTSDYMTMIFLHDNDISDLTEKKEIAQGTAFYDLGTAGGVSYHVHFECAVGKYVGYEFFYQNSPIYIGNAIGLINGIDPEKALYKAKDTTIESPYYGVDLAWVTLP